MLIRQYQLPFIKKGTQKGVAPSETGESHPLPGLFIDIETTGLSRESTILYLLGCAYYEAGTLQLIQWFNDDGRSEKEILESFCHCLADHQGPLFTFNGDHFDLPWLRYHLASHGLPPIPKTCISCDLYRVLHPFQKVFGLARGRQKDWENFMGFHRDDSMSGKDLIRVYRKYLTAASGTRSLESSRADNQAGSRAGSTAGDQKQNQTGKLTWNPKNQAEDPTKGRAEVQTGNQTRHQTKEQARGHSQTAEDLLRLLLLHNYEDVLYLTRLTPLLSLKKLTDGNFSIDRASFDGTWLTFDCILDTGLPGTCSIRDPKGCIQGCGRSLRIALPVLSGECKHFFPDYRNYYYLPVEDRAIHKSVGQYVDQAHRQPCRPQNCYIKKSGHFLPIYDKKSLPSLKLLKESVLFQKEYGDATIFLELAGSNKRPLLPDQATAPPSGSLLPDQDTVLSSGSFLPGQDTALPSGSLLPDQDTALPSGSLLPGQDTVLPSGSFQHSPGEKKAGPEWDCLKQILTGNLNWLFFNKQIEEREFVPVRKES